MFKKRGYTKKFLFIIIFSLFFTNTLCKASSNNELKEKNFYTKPFSNELINSQYIVDTGDVLYLNFKDINIFTRAYSVNVNGEIYLPEIGFFSVKGKTTKEIKSQLLEKYKEVIINPMIEVSITKYRPLSIYIGGEVNRPGLYKIEYKESSLNTDNFKNVNIEESSYIDYGGAKTITNSQNVPRLFDALKKVDGLTNKADLSSIKIVRKNSQTFGGGTIKANINLIRLIKNGDQSQNIRLFDGDYIFIPASEKILLDQIIDINRTNLNPREIQVFITGNVLSPGRKILKQNSSLVEAIMAAGGKQMGTGNVQFVRLKRNGNSEKRIFGYDASATKGSYKNPILIEGDLIVLNKNLIKKATSIISEVGSPLINSYAIYKIFE